MTEVRVTKVFGAGIAVLVAAFALVAALFAAQPAYAAQDADLAAGSIDVATQVVGPTTAQARIGETVTVSNIQNKAANQGTCTWTAKSSNTGIATATVSGSGTTATLKVTGVADGTATITVTCKNGDGLTADHAVKVKVIGIKANATVNNIVYKKTGLDTVTLLNAKKFTKATCTIGNTIKLADKSGFEAEYKITKIAKGAFLKNKKVKTITVGNNVEEIGAHAFCMCTKLSKLTLGTGVKKIGAQIVHIKNNKLKTITIKSKKLTKANIKNCFKYNKYLKTVKVPKAKKKAYKKIFTKKICGKKVTVK